MKEQLVHPVPKRERLIHDNLDELDKSLGELTEAINTLNGELLPVMKPTDDEELNIADSTASESPVATATRMMVLRVEYLTSRVQEMASKLQI